MKCLKLAAIALSLSLAGSLWADEHDLDAEVEAMDGATRNVSDAQIGKLEGQLGDFAGDNTQPLLEGLRTGSIVMVNDLGEEVTVDVEGANNGMGYGGVFITAAMAVKLLGDVGDVGADATPENIAAVLEGGTVTLADGTVVEGFSGLLADRAAGMGWGEIAQANGFKLGELMSDLRSARGDKPAHAKGHRGMDIAKVDHSNRPETGSRPERPEKAQRPERPERVERPERPERPDRPERPGRS